MPKQARIEKAYKNQTFLNSPSARTLRVLSEMIEPAERLRINHIRNTVVFFGSARIQQKRDVNAKLKKIKAKKKLTVKDKKNIVFLEKQLYLSRYFTEAEELACRLTKWFHTPEVQKKFIICSGGGPGIMEAANKGAKKAKGRSIGLNISLPHEQAPNPYQDMDLSFEFHYFFIRKFWFFYLAKALVVFPGGFGTLDEFFELLTLIQTGKTKKYMPVILYGPEFWEGIINLKEMANWGVISPDDLNLFNVCATVDDAFEYLKKELTKHYLK